MEGVNDALASVKNTIGARARQLHSMWTGGIQWLKTNHNSIRSIPTSGNKI
jgi:hypothetical protein